MYKVHLFKHKSQFNNLFNINPGNQGSPIIYLEYIHLVLARTQHEFAKLPPLVSPSLYICVSVCNHSFHTYI
jgi:hypothetical protein